MFWRENGGKRGIGGHLCAIGAQLGLMRLNAPLAGVSLQEREVQNRKVRGLDPRHGGGAIAKAAGLHINICISQVILTRQAQMGVAPDDGINTGDPGKAAQIALSGPSIPIWASKMTTSAPLRRSSCAASVTHCAAGVTQPQPASCCAFRNEVSWGSTDNIPTRRVCPLGIWVSAQVRMTLLRRAVGADSARLLQIRGVVTHRAIRLRYSIP
jgi:hypothetical protein